MVKAALVLLLLWLVALGLNISSQGINQLSGETRGPVISLGLHNRVLHWDWLGRGYDYPLVRLQGDVQVLGERFCKYLHGVRTKVLPDGE